MTAYSFADVEASISGPGGNFPLCGAEAGVAEEGITIAATNESNVLTTGADGGWMHSLRVEASGTVTVRLLKTSTINRQLMELYTHQRASARTWGQNVITLRDLARGDTVTCTGAAFGKVPDLGYAVEGGTVEWTFQCGKIQRDLGPGIGAAG